MKRSSLRRIFRELDNLKRDGMCTVVCCDDARVTFKMGRVSQRNRCLAIEPKQVALPAKLLDHNINIVAAVGIEVLLECNDDTIVHESQMRIDVIAG